MLPPVGAAHVVLLSGIPPQVLRWPTRQRQAVTLAGESVGAYRARDQLHVVVRHERDLHLDAGGAGDEAAGAELLEEELLLLLHGDSELGVAVLRSARDSVSSRGWWAG